MLVIPFWDAPHILLLQAIVDTIRMRIRPTQFLAVASRWICPCFVLPIQVWCQLQTPQLRKDGRLDRPGTSYQKHGVGCKLQRSPLPTALHSPHLEVIQIGSCPYSRYPPHLYLSEKQSHFTFEFGTGRH